MHQNGHQMKVSGAVFLSDDERKCSRTVLIGVIFLYLPAHTAVINSLDAHIMLTLLTS